MSPIGAHVSIKDGYAGAFQEALGLGASALQLFGKSPMSGKLREVTVAEGKEVASLPDRKKIRYAVIHASYLLNFAKKLPAGSYQARSLSEDLRGADKLGADGVVLHMGKSVDGDRLEAENHFVTHIVSLLKETSDLKAKIILENTAGQGTEMGFQFEEYDRIYKKIKKLAGKEQARLAMCLDTAHAYGAGYDLRTKAGCAKTLDELDRHIGLEEIACVHFNDSKKALGSRVDRHQDLGHGTIGNTGLHAFVEALDKARTKPTPLILETPQEHVSYAKQLKLLANWV